MVCSCSTKLHSHNLPSAFNSSALALSSGDITFDLCSALDRLSVVGWADVEPPLVWNVQDWEDWLEVIPYDVQYNTAGLMSFTSAFSTQIFHFIGTIVDNVGSFWVASVSKQVLHVSTKPLL